MACRQTGCALLCSNHPQEAQDLALVAHAATLKGRLPVIHFFDGFRTSHEIAKITPLPDSILREMIDPEALAAFRRRALSPDRPTIQGTAQNPDVYFQGRETVNTFVDAFPGVVAAAMDQLAALTGRKYSLVEYYGHPQAERAVVCMGSGVEALQAAADHLNATGQRVGVISIRLFQPFPVEAFLKALPPTVRTLGVLDRTKEPGAVGEPLFMSVLSALSRAEHPTAVPPSRVFGGRYGLGSKEFTPAMAEAVFTHLNAARPKHGFTIGIHDDVTHTSLAFDPAFSIEDPATVRAIFYGLGADGTVGANKNSIKIIGEETDNHAQGYFVYDSKKSGSLTVSHLRFGPRPIRAPYLISRATFVACHQFSFLDRLDVLREAEPGAVFLLNSPYGPEKVWDHLPRTAQRQIVDKKLRLFVIDGDRVARDAGMGGRVNTVMQTCFFAISGVLPRDEAVAAIKRAIEKTYGRRGEPVVRRNWRRWTPRSPTWSRCRCRRG
jgi:pyruvate-ferredoxin/flavodoxin oxidoreductase